MASYSMEDFVGNGALKDLLPTLVDEGWDDVPTLKVMNSEDMQAIRMSQRQKNALEIRSYLHDRALMQYGDSLEDSGKSLPELLSLSSADLSSQFGMRRGHIARFIERTNPCYNPLPASIALPPRKGNTSSRNSSLYSVDSRKMHSATRSSTRSMINDGLISKSISSFKIGEGYIFKGIVAAAPAEPRACGCIQPPPVVDSVAPHSAIENISVQKLTPEYKMGMENVVKTKAPSVKASELWKEKPALLLCIRRPGCIMCRAEAHQLYAKKPIFDALGVQLFAVIHEHIQSEIKDFWPRYWGGAVLHDRSMDFFKALGGGKLNKDKFLSGFLLNPRAIANYKRAKAMRAEMNYIGEGEIKGGLFLVGSGKSGVAYQFIERNFGDVAPIAEIIEICTRLQNPYVDQDESVHELTGSV